MASETPNFGHNNPMHTHHAIWDGHRSVRFDSGEGLATVGYSYKLSHWEMLEMAERITLALNAVRGADKRSNPRSFGGFIMTQTPPIWSEQVDVAEQLYDTLLPLMQVDLPDVYGRKVKAQSAILAALNAAASIPASRGAETEGALDASGLTAAAKVIAADVIGYAWDGMGESSVTDKGFAPLIYSGHGGLKFQGGHKDLEQYAASIVSAYLSASPALPVQEQEQEQEPVGYIRPESLVALREGKSGPVVGVAAFDTVIPLYALPPNAGEIEAGEDHIAKMVEQAFRDGIAYASLCEVTDVDLAWSQSRARVALVKP